MASIGTMLAPADVDNTCFPARASRCSGPGRVRGGGLHRGAEAGREGAPPVVGAVAGGVVNLLFMDHFQEVARGHFVVKRLEKTYGAEAVRATYERLEILSPRPGRVPCGPPRRAGWSGRSACAGSTPTGREGNSGCSAA